MFKLSKQCGFAMLYASLVGSLVLAIGIAILNVTVKQITLSSAGRESQHAFYGADTGMECALYMDRGAGGNDACSGTVFATVENPSLCINGPDGITPFLYKCIGSDVLIDTNGFPEVTADAVTSHIYVETNPSENICFDVYVTKNSDNTTDIDSRGYSTCDKTVANRFERAIRSSF